MFNKIIVPPDVVGGNEVNTDKVGSIHTPIHKIAFGVEGTITPIDGANPLPVTVGLTDDELRATPVPVSMADAATETTLDAINDKLPTAIVDMPTQDTPSLPIRQAPQKYWDWSFAKVIASNVDATKATLIRSFTKSHLYLNTAS